MEGMMMKKYLFLSIAALAILFSCENALREETGVIEEPANIESSMPDVFYATIDAETKAGFNYNGTDTYSHFWNLGDQIYVFHESTRRTYTCTDAANGAFTYVDASEFDVSPKTYTNYCAVFNSTNSTEPSAYNHDVLSGIWQYGYYTSSSPANGYANVMVANSTDDHLEFKSITGWLKLSLKGWKTVSSIGIVSNDYGSYLNGTYSVTFNANETIDINWFQDDNTGNTVVLATPVALNFSTATDFYLALPPCSMNGITVTVNYADSSSDVISTGNTVVIDRNKVTPMAACFTRAFTDLSPASGGALTYIVSAGGYYKFNAKTPDISRQVWDASPETTAASIVWETDNTATPVSAGDIIEVLGHDDHYVYFKTANTFKEGNALIQTNNFCYHIWCTDAPADIQLTGSLTVLDRNIGALSADPSDGILSQGLYYQIFRPTPFPGNHSASASITTAAPAGWATAKVNPTVFYIKSESSDKSWVDKNNYLTTINNHWFAAGSDAYKSVYDPCPAGYVLMKTPVSTLTATAATGGFTVKESTNSYTPSYFPEGSIGDTGSYVGTTTTWFNHRYNYQYVYISQAVEGEIQPANAANEFKGYQLRCQKQ